MVLTIMRDGAALDLSGTGIWLYLLWRHRQASTRGCAPLEAVDAAAGRFRVFWPDVMCAAEGAAECEIVLSWESRTLLSPAFEVRIGPSLAGTLALRDGFTLFVDAIKHYEDAAADALSVAAEIIAARDAGEFDGADGAAGSPGRAGPERRRLHLCRLHDRAAGGAHRPAGAAGRDRTPRPPGRDGTAGAPRPCRRRRHNT
ncbi:MAG: hypothetical protein LKE27_07490 [Atopobiaceae bacterium]|nr:hypothetical protein [Atopobiaceae bacterium]